MVPGRPDMALFLFTDAIRNGRPIDIFNQGAMVRDFTYIDDIVEGVIRFDKTATPDPDFNNESGSRHFDGAFPGVQYRQWQSDPADGLYRRAGRCARHDSKKEYDAHAAR